MKKKRGSDRAEALWAAFALAFLRGLARAEGNPLRRLQASLELRARHLGWRAGWPPEVRMSQRLQATLAGAAWLALSLSLLPAGLDAQGPAAEPRDRSWEFGLTGNLEQRDLEGVPRATGGSLGIQAGRFLPQSLTRFGDALVYVSLVQNKAIGARAEDDLALFTGDVGLQLETRWPSDGLRVVGRVAAGVRHTAEVLEGDLLTNYSGSGVSLAVGVRRPLFRSVRMELSVTRSSGTFRDVQIQDLGDFTDVTERVHVRHEAWRLGLGFVL